MPAAPAPGPFELHEWGLLGIALDGDQGATVVAGPRHERGALEEALLGGGVGGNADDLLKQLRGVRVAPDRSGRSLRSRGGGKPVIYVHLRAGVTEASFDASIVAPGGRLVEHWPPGALGRVGSGERVTWNVVARREPCPAASVPTLRSPECAAVSDGYCELAELSGYAVREPACVRVADRDAPVLFYRSALPRTVSPLDVRRLADGAVSVTTPPGSPPLGSLMRVRRAWSMGSTRVEIVAAPLAGQSSSIGPPAGTADGTDARRFIAEGLRGAGLTPEEISAFERAWTTELLGDEPPAPGQARLIGAIGVTAPRSTAPSALARATDYIAFFLPRPVIDQVAPLTTSPPAAAIARAWLVRVNLDPAPAPR